MSIIMLPSAKSATDIAIPLDNIAWVEWDGENTRVYLRHPIASPPNYFLVALPMTEVVRRMNIED